MSQRPNIVVVVLDTTRFDDALDSSIAPTLVDIGTAGTTMTQAISTAPWTLPAHASMVTGTYPSKHGAHSDHERLGDSLPTLPEILQNAGYKTACVSNNTWLSRESGFDRGFDTFEQMWQVVQSETALSELVDVTEESRLKAVGRRLSEGNPLANVANILYRLVMSQRSDYGGERTTSWVADWLTAQAGPSGPPFFLFVNYLEPHLSYEPPQRLAERFLPAGYTYEEAMEIPQQPWEYLAEKVTLEERELEALRGLYRAEVAYADEQLAKIKRRLIETGQWEDTVLLVTADHGENIGHHGMLDHQYCLYDSLVHVPFVVQGGPFTDGDVVRTPVSLTDIPPTLLDVAAVEAPAARAEFQGRSLHPDSKEPAPEYVISEYLAPLPSMEALEQNVGELPDHVYEYDRSLRAIRTNEYKLIRGSDGSVELYELDTNPAETINISSTNPQEVERLSTHLDEWLDSFQHADTEESVTINGARKEQLEELGYLQ